jgi:nucleotide-binding universal stress UspA family protein
MAFAHILVPTDFSPLAHEAVTYALREAELHHAKVTLHHHPDAEVHYLRGGPADPRGFVSEVGGSLPVTSTPDVSVVRHDYLEEATTKMRDLIPHGFSESSAVEVERGDPADTIVHKAQELGADLIVIGTHGRTGLAHIFLGSVAEKVLRRAHCPVLVVRKFSVA